MDHFNIPENPGDYAGDHPVLTNVIIRSGAIVALTAAGYAVEAASAITGHAIGRAVSGADNTGGASGDQKVRVKRGVFALALDATNPPGIAHVGGRVGISAPDTASSTLGTCRGGICIGFDPAGRCLVDFKDTTKTAGL